MDRAICSDSILPMSDSAATNRQYNRQSRSSSVLPSCAPPDARDKRASSEIADPLNPIQGQNTSESGFLP